MSTPTRRPRWRTTRWSLVAAAGRGDEDGRRALDELCALYRPAVVAWFRAAGGCGADEAEDLVQGLFLDLIGRRAFAEADADKGRFRAWLKGCARHFAAKDRRARAALRRGGGVRHLAIGTPAAGGGRGGGDPGGDTVAEPGADLETPDRAFDRAFACSLLAAVLERLEAEYAARGRGPWFDALRGYLEVGGGPGYGHSAAALGMQVGAVKVAVHRMRARFRELLVAEVRQTLVHPDDDPVDDELGALLDALSGPGPSGGSPGAAGRDRP